MTNTSRVIFEKMHACGNDFIIIDARKHNLNIDENTICKLSNRRTGIGCDQVILIKDPLTHGSTASMTIFNCDGGIVEACGNASRCVASLLMKESNLRSCSIETCDRTLECECMSGNTIRINMGQPSFMWSDIPLAYNPGEPYLTFNQFNDIEISKGYYVNIGNPHCVFFIDNPDNIDLATVGKAIEYDLMFPNHINVEFVCVTSKHNLYARVWERGAGDTGACGTGACASAIVAIQQNLVTQPVNVFFSKQDEAIIIESDGTNIFMTGKIHHAFSGSVLI